MKSAWYPDGYYLHSYFIYSATMSGSRQVSKSLLAWSYKIFSSRPKTPSFDNCKTGAITVIHPRHTGSICSSSVKHGSSLFFRQRLVGQVQYSQLKRLPRRKASEYREYHDRRWITCCQSAWFFPRPSLFQLVWFARHELGIVDPCQHVQIF